MAFLDGNSPYNSKSFAGSISFSLTEGLLNRLFF
ncbi:hypothetical protein X742_23555 [Mesorhizobium sp. LNHC232B00]|nr:hypothetical protein X742_23555 [Mesorhizobium sp. LNHC232B00]